MARRPVTMAITVVSRQHAVEELGKIRFGARTELDQGHAGCRMRNKDVAEPIAPPVAELPHHIGQVGHPAIAGVHLDERGLHAQRA